MDVGFYFPHWNVVRHLTTMAKAWALLQGRNFVVPFDVATVAVFVLTHRITLSGDAASRGKHGESHSTTMTLSSYDDFVAQSSEGEAGQGQTLRTNLTLITNVIASVPPPS
mmetsp:Transcript_56501/g.92908  ORF Transcript_56501/g.92908 Transcript_56501/m.92908 type:complete len:111 (+) Transcript_56501:179-511(+)